MMYTVKRVLSALTAGTILAAGAVFPAVSAETAVVRGDINQSGTADADDAVFVLYYYNATLMGNEAACLEMLEKMGVTDIFTGDLNGDDKVDTDDAVLLLRFTADSLVLPELTPDEIWETILPPVSDEL